jgi:hypothetical protein
MATSVFCIAKSDRHASNIIDDLKVAGFTFNDISVLMSDQSGTRDLAHERSTKAPEGAAAGAATGAVLGGALGWMAGIGLLAIPGIGPLIAAGPIMAALSGAATVGAFGGVAGGLMGLGAPEYEAKRYEGKLQAGNVLISVHTDTSEEADRVVKIFGEARAEDISRATEDSVVH